MGRHSLHSSFLTCAQNEYWLSLLLLLLLLSFTCANFSCECVRVNEFSYASWTKQPPRNFYSHEVPVTHPNRCTSLESSRLTKRACTALQGTFYNKQKQSRAFHDIPSLGALEIIRQSPSTQPPSQSFLGSFLPTNARSIEPYISFPDLANHILPTIFR